MIKKALLKEIDRAIKEIWLRPIKKDYFDVYLIKEDALKCSMYYHMRRKLSQILRGNNLRIIPEFYIQPLGKRADLAIVEMDFDLDVGTFKDYISDIIAIIELKYVAGFSNDMLSWVKDDIWKMKQYLQEGHMDCQYYFACIYEEECAKLQWMDYRSINNWASGRVTELNAGYIDGKMTFEVNSYNDFNKDLNA